MGRREKERREKERRLGGVRRGGDGKMRKDRSGEDWEGKMEGIGKDEGKGRGE